MRFFCFTSLVPESDLRKKIDGFISSDEPDMSAPGIKRWGKGLHFIKNDAYIEGFFQNVDWREARGFPLKSRFRGEFTVNEIGAIEFRGWIYPAFPEFVFQVCLWLWILFSEFYAGVIFIAMLIVFGYIRLFEDNAVALKDFLISQ